MSLLLTGTGRMTAAPTARPATTTTKDRTPALAARLAVGYSGRRLGLFQVHRRMAPVRPLRGPDVPLKPDYSTPSDFSFVISSAEYPASRSTVSEC